MKLLLAKSFLFTILFMECISVRAQLEVTPDINAHNLIQKLVGEGIVVSNPSLNVRRTARPTGIFINRGGVGIGIDSGILLTNGRAGSDLGNNLYGVDGNGTFTASSVLADNDLAMPGDITLANELGISVNQVFDAIVLEFDFISYGDSIKFNYVMSSEEYTPGTVCVFNDAFGFFISGPGITGSKNIALIPGTNIPVAITNVNNITAAACVNNPQYYIDNTSNTFFVHEGHTSVFTAVARVQPCQTYHLKLVVADIRDHAWDTGVFLEAGSLRSNKVKLERVTSIDQSGNNYLAEGCTPGYFVVSRPGKYPVPLDVSLTYTGTATNGADVQMLPSSVTIPAHDSFVVVNILPVIDGLPEGIEFLRIDALAGCPANNPADSIIIQVRDYDPLDITPDTTDVCLKGTVQLSAAPGYTGYQWNNHSTLTDAAINNPIATPVKPFTVYICTASTGISTCHARDSVLIRLKDVAVKIFAGNDTVAVMNQPIQLFAQDIINGGITNYTWSPGTFLNNPGIASPVAVLPNDHYYVVTGTTPGGCEVKDDIFIKVYNRQGLYVPSGFTPNQDGLNDILKIIPAGIKELRYFRIFNRWGQLVFFTRNSYQGWDGKLNGVSQPAGVYVWMAEVLDSKSDVIQYKGVVSIIR